MHPRRLVVLIAASAVLLPAAQAAVTGTADGVQHVVWRVDDADRTYGYVHTTISRTGAQGPVTTVLPSWSQLDPTPDLAVDPDGALRLAFRGSTDGGTATFFSYKGIYTAVSRDGGATWTVPREVLARSSTLGGATLAHLPDGRTIAGSGDTGGFHWDVGSIPEAPVPTSTNQEFTDHDAIGASLVRSGGSVLVAYQSFRAGALHVRQVWPTLGTPVRAPGSYTNPDQPVAVVDRPGVGPVVGYTIRSRVHLWDVTANELHRVRGMDGAQNVSLAVLPDGHLWVAAEGAAGYVPRVARVSARGWTIDRRRWRVGRAQEVEFRVTDVDGGVAGAVVRAGGERCTTTGAGRCRIRYAAAARPRSLVARARKAGYSSAEVRIRVVR